MKPDLHLIDFRTKSIADLEACKKTLNEDETLRMQRFMTPELQQKFALSRGSLRFTLGKYLHQDPGSLEFTYNDFGKPSVKNVQFNMAHSGHYCVIALLSSGLIGIDIEQVDRQLEILDIAKRFFTKKEYTAILQAEQARETFFHIWTQKEAFLKAIGKGISFGLDQFEVATNLDQAYVRAIQDPEYAKINWQSQINTSIPDYRLALTFCL